MLRKLTVQNFAIIRSLEVDFSEGFTVITGETGAGKSILMGALSLVTGSRADSSVLLDREAKCFVEAEFIISGDLLEDFFNAEDIDFQNPCIIRREINPAGKSRSFINDTPVSLQQLKKLSTLLIDIHSQHQTLELKESEKRFEYLDAFAGHSDLSNTYREKYDLFRRLKSKVKQMEESAAHDAKEMDYLKFQLSELDAFRPQLQEYDTLKEQHEILGNAETSSTALAEAVFLLDDDETSVRMLFSRLRNLMPMISRLGHAGRNVQERFASLDAELKDLTQELRHLSNHIFPDPVKLEEVSARMAGYEMLFRKHQCQSSEDLCKIHEQLSARCEGFSNNDVLIAEIRKQLEQAEKSMHEAGKVLSYSRRNAGQKFSDELNELLFSLEMKDARIFWKILPSSEAHANGTDEIEILFSANSGHELQPLSKTASGGELSRVMLTIKTLVAQHSALPAIIFDEIDTGVSGKVAAAIGGMMRSMGKTMQVISITHLPQVAAHGQHHFEVFKFTHNGVTETSLKKLSGEERLSAIAHMISHEKVSDAALKHAKDLLKAGNLS